MKRSFINDPYLKLWLPLYELDGNSFMSKDIYGHLCAKTGTTWGIQGGTFDGDDYISVPHSSALTFTSGDFSLGAWIKATDISGPSRDLIVKGLFNADGYRLRLDSNGVVYFVTYQVGAGQETSTAAGTIAINNFYHVFVTRSGAVAKIYVNGVDVTSVSGTHIDPVTNTRNLLIGTYDTALYFFVGIIGDALIHSRAPSAAEVQNIYLATKWRFSG